MAVTLRARRCFESPSVPCACDAGVGNATAFVNLYGNFSDVLSRSAVVDQVFRRSASDARCCAATVHACTDMCTDMRMHVRTDLCAFVQIDMHRHVCRQRIDILMSSLF